MVLMMARPYRHPRTGVYWLRKAVPEALRTVVGKRELVRTLDTKDPREACKRAPAVLASFDATLEAARKGDTKATLKDLMGLAGEWYRREIAAWGDDPDQAGDLGIYRDTLIDQVMESETEDPTADHIIMWKPQDLTEASLLLTAHGYAADTDSTVRLARAIWDMRFKAINELERRLAGDWSPDKTLDKFPVAPQQQTEAAVRVTFQSLIAAWASETGTAGKSLYDRVRTAVRLAEFVGHDDAARLTADDVVRWKEARLAQGRKTNTVANDIGELRPIWKWGKLNRKLSFSENPFAGLSPRTKKFRRVRKPYTEDEANQILTLARTEKDASLRWLPWLLCFTGCRLGEITQAVKEDVRREDGGPVFIHVHGEGEGRSLKTTQSERMIPLHPALVAEGLLDYVASLPPGSSLFPDLRPDKFGTLTGTATKKHGRWVRLTARIVDPAKAPAHAWRHRFEDQARRAGVPQNVTDALMGHLNAANESEGYGRGYQAMPDVTAPWVEKMAVPMGRPGGPLMTVLSERVEAAPVTGPVADLSSPGAT